MDFTGNTGPFIQYTHARIQSILRKADADLIAFDDTVSLHEKEKSVLKTLGQFPATVAAAAKQFSPALVANYVYNLVKHYNSYYQEVSILVENAQTKAFRVALCAAVGQVIQKSLGLLGIEAPNRM